MYKVYQKNIELGDGRVITLETGKLAKQADGSVVVKCGDTMILATVVSAKESKVEVDFMPLSVDYQEKFASFGRFPGGFQRREGKPGDNEILIGRLVDRALRPLFPSDFHAETFVTITLISAGKENMPDTMAGLAASAALAVSDIPFNGPISEVRVSRVNGKLKINPTYSELENSDIDIMIGATYDNILMIEGEMMEVSEKDMLEAIKFGHDAIKIHCKAQMEWVEEMGGRPKRKYEEEIKDENLKNEIYTFAYDKQYAVAKLALPKKERSEKFEEIRKQYIEEKQYTPEELKEKKLLIDRYFHDSLKKVVREMILNDGIRIDGRKTNEIRPIWCEIDYLPAAHGSSIFTRGETQSLTTVTLGTKVDEKIIDEVLNKGTDKFLLHYNFPPFSTGDARPSRGLSRREVGHGNLAHRALKRMIPAQSENPYTIRLVSDILESNGSSSMATVCAGTLALMDAGVKMKRPVSGIAMGLITDISTKKFAVLSDILGDEDHLGDMDFKVTGTTAGVTACQMDIKVEGLSYEIMEQALQQAHEGRMHILGKILETISEPRADYKPHAPRIEKIVIAREMIGAIIGPGGKVVQDIQAKTGTTISITEIDGKGEVMVSATNKEAIDNAMFIIKGIVEIPEVGKVYKGKVKSILAFGAFVEILPGKDGLLHISEIDWSRLNTVEEVLKEGDIIEVQVIEIDKKTNKLKLSRKVLLPRPENQQKKQ